ncbi:uncharacterized, partial [Tachysurus ichikawai]
MNTDATSFQMTNIFHSLAEVRFARSFRRGSRKRSAYAMPQDSSIFKQDKLDSDSIHSLFLLA